MAEVVLPCDMDLPACPCMNGTLAAGVFLRHGAWNYGVGVQRTSDQSTPLLSRRPIDFCFMIMLAECGCVVTIGYNVDMPKQFRLQPSSKTYSAFAG